MATTAADLPVAAQVAKAGPQLLRAGQELIGRRAFAEAAYCLTRITLHPALHSAEMVSTAKMHLARALAGDLWHNKLLALPPHQVRGALTRALPLALPLSSRHSALIDSPAPFAFVCVARSDGVSDGSERSAFDRNANESDRRVRQRPTSLPRDRVLGPCAGRRSDCRLTGAM